MQFSNFQRVLHHCTNQLSSFPKLHSSSTESTAFKLSPILPVIFTLRSSAPSTFQRCTPPRPANVTPSTSAPRSIFSAKSPVSSIGFAAR